MGWPLKLYPLLHHTELRKCEENRLGDQPEGTRAGQLGEEQDSELGLCSIYFFEQR